MAAIEVQNVVVRYDDGRVALDGISLAVEDGEFVVLLGPTGSGKSTLLRVVSGLEGVSSGRVLLDGVDCTRRPSAQRNVSMVFQQYALYPHLTAYENIAFPLKTGRDHKFTHAEVDALVHDASRTLGLDSVLDVKPKRLSGGERQRVAMARAMVRQSEALLLDEPLSNMDAHVRAQLRAEIRQIQGLLGITTLYVTHDQSEAMALADRIAVLDQGKVLQYGTPADVYDHPVNVFVADFIGLPSMSFLPATIDGELAILSFGFVRLSPDKARRVTDGEYLIGLRPEEVPDAEVAADRHSDRRRYLKIPSEIPDSIHPDLARWEEELTGGWLHTTFGLRTESTKRFLGQTERSLYVDGQRLHVFDPQTGVNLTRGEL